MSPRCFTPLLVLPVLSFAAPSARAHVWAAVHPKTVEPGGVFQVKAGDTERASVTATARFQGTTRRLAAVNGATRALFGAPASLRAGAYTVQLTVNGRPVRATVRVKAKNFPKQDIRMKPSKTSLMDPSILARERTILNAAYDTYTPRPLWTGAFVAPSPGPSTSAWGRRRTVNGRPWGQHQGADISAPTGTPIAATNAGTVAVAQALWMRGNTVVIDHGLGVFSVYNHLHRIDVREGDSVERGQRIGSVGATGFVTGAHLHWEMRIGRVSVNPWPIVRSGVPLG